ncbi:MAG: WYL domain-containing protein [Chloroflexales bacterium]|nr:WYL domain-containing protein [Chloroflexales bacterium]
MKQTESKYERFDAIERLLVRHPAGLTTGEIARALGVNPSTIYRDIQFLEGRGTGLIQDRRRYKLDHRRSLTTLKLTNDELMALYLAVRLLSRHSDEHNPHVVQALEKLADSLRTRSPLMSDHMDMAANAVRHRRPRPEYVAALEGITQGWAERRKVRFCYRDRKGQTTERSFAPYYLEPSGIGYACYAIGFDDQAQALRTFKVERMRSLQVTDERYLIPETFDPQRQLANAWGVIWRDEGGIEVTLRFAPPVVQRVKESVWHHSQRLEDLPDGSCLFTVQVGSTLEMKPWIRQWGADVVVLAPEALREELTAEVQRMAANYGLT